MSPKADDPITEASTPCYIKARYVLAFMAFLGMFNIFCLRVSLSVAIVAMVNTSRGVNIADNSTTCPDRSSNLNSTTENNDAAFSWDSAEQGLLLGIYFYGYMCTCVLGGYLGTRFGARLVMGVSMLLSALLTLLFPLVANISYPALLALRLLTGFFQGVGSASLQSAWGRWAPPLERSMLVSFTISGASFGAFITLPVAGIIADTLGWEFVFYFTGGGALLWSVIWLSIIHSSPENHPRISKQEKAYIAKSIGVLKGAPANRARTPWRAILTSGRVWAIAAAHASMSFGNSTFLLLLPTYMATILRFDLSTSGVLSAIPYLLRFFVACCAGYATDVIRSRKIMTTLAVRKTNTTLGLILPAILVVMASYGGCNVPLVVAFFALSISLSALTLPGFHANTVDIAPKYAGIIFGLSNTCASAAGSLGPQIAGLILLNDGSIGQWRKVFFMVAAVQVFGAVVYLIFGSADEQPWASGKKGAEHQSTDVLDKENTEEKETFAL